MSIEPLGTVQIGAREIYDVVVQTRATVERLAAQHAETRTEVRDHEERIRILEKARWPLPSLAAAISLAALIITYLRP